MHIYTHAAEKTNHSVELETYICRIGVQSLYLLDKVRLQEGILGTSGRIVENRIANCIAREGRRKTK